MSFKPNIATVTTLSASIRDTLSFIRYHLNSGIDHMYLFFDNPEDEAITYLGNNTRVSCFRCNKKHWLKQGIKPQTNLQIKQKINATFALRLARQADIDWLMHLDSDELLYSKCDFNKLFSNISKEVDVIRFPVLEAVPQKIEYDNPFLGITDFKVYLDIWLGNENFIIKETDKQRQLKRTRFWYYRKQLYQLLSRKFNRNLTGSFLLGHTVGKAATRTTAKIQQIDCHIPIPLSDFKLNMIVAQQAYILHYDCLGYNRWRQKWKKRIDKLVNDDEELRRKQRNKQQYLFQKALEQGEEKVIALYKKLYQISQYERLLLYTTGMMRKITHDKKLFD